jgi:DNA-binding FadR family transcriptional regulator
MTPKILIQLEKLMAQMEDWNGTLPEAAALDLEFHRTLWRAAGNPYLERALNALMVPLFAHKTLEHVTKDVRRWRHSHHRMLLEAVASRSQVDPQDVLQSHMRMSYTDPERYSTWPRNHLNAGDLANAKPLSQTADGIGLLHDVVPWQMSCPPPKVYCLQRWGRPTST